MQKIVYIVGPTGVGKTDLAFSLAKEFNAELISADSIQVYKGLDIVSGKDLSKTALKHGNNAGFYIDRGIPIFLLDIVDPTSPFSVSNFQDIASRTLGKILKKNKLPIVVGGTGLYVKSLLEPIDTASIKPDTKLRSKLEKLSILDLQKLLPSEKLNSLNDSDRNNPRRLIRAIEVERSRIKNQELEIKEKTGQESLVIGLFCDREVLKQRINSRVDARLKQDALGEVEKIFEIYEDLAPQIKDANGYKQLFQYLQGEISLEEAVYRWKISEYRHAKNQMTWFRKYGNTVWFDIEKKNYIDEIKSELINFLTK